MTATSTHDMVLLLTGLLSYRALKVRRDELALPLDEEERRRLEELERVFSPATGESGGVDGGAARPPYLVRLEGRSRVRLPVEFRDGHGEPRDGTLTDLSAMGCFIETVRPATLSEAVAMRFVDVGAGREWHFAGEVERLGDAMGAGMGVSFVGVPLELRVGAAPHSGRERWLSARPR